MVQLPPCRLSRGRPAVCGGVSHGSVGGAYLTQTLRLVGAVPGLVGFCLGLYLVFGQADWSVVSEQQGIMPTTKALPPWFLAGPILWLVWACPPRIYRSCFSTLPYIVVIVTTIASLGGPLADRALLRSVHSACVSVLERVATSIRCDSDDASRPDIGTDVSTADQPLAATWRFCRLHWTPGGTRRGSGRGLCFPKSRRG